MSDPSTTAQASPRIELTFTGTPMQIGTQMWTVFCGPMLASMQGMPPDQRAQVYAGVIMTALGALTVDLGHAMSTSLANDLLGALAKMPRDNPELALQ